MSFDYLDRVAQAGNALSSELDALSSNPVSLSSKLEALSSKPWGGPATFLRGRCA